MIQYLARIPGFIRLWKRMPIGSVPLRVEYDVWDRPHYAYGIYQAAQLASRLGLPGISVIEFGVAGGNGLLAMERIAKKVSEHFGITIKVFGFDTGEGMPAPLDYRDLPHTWEQGFYKMEPDKLRARLQGAELVLGQVGETLPIFLNLREREHSPIGFIAFDLDYYSSTKSAFQVFSGSPQTRLPRVYCYMDDIVWPERACHNDYIGELCAIREFNEESKHQKITPLTNLIWMRRLPSCWTQQIYVMHDFKHPSYTTMITPVGEKYRQIPLT